MTPEEKARQTIDRKLDAAGWIVQDFKTLNLGAGRGIAVREYPTDTGPADYVLFVDREAVGVIEAKRDEAAENITAAEGQTERYGGALLKWRVKTTPLPFLFESTAQIIRFTDGRDPAPRSRELFHFFRPEQLAQWSQVDLSRKIPTTNPRAYCSNVSVPNEPLAQRSAHHAEEDQRRLHERTRLLRRITG